MKKGTPLLYSPFQKLPKAAYGQLQTLTHSRNLAIERQVPVEDRTLIAVDFRLASTGQRLVAYDIASKCRENRCHVVDSPAQRFADMLEFGLVSSRKCLLGEGVTDTGIRQRLAAILAADVAGYSRLMAADERAPVAALDAARAVFRTQIESNQGRVIGKGTQHLERHCIVFIVVCRQAFFKTCHSGSRDSCREQ